MIPPQIYLAQKDDSTPHGWVTSEGMFFRPDWGDELIEIGGKPHIKVSETLPCNRHKSGIPPLTSAFF